MNNYAKQIKAIVFDIDGVMTDGKKYIDGEGHEYKSVSMKDIDALTSFKQLGYYLCAITGENTSFSQQLKRDLNLDFFELGCKDKMNAIHKIEKQFDLPQEAICYIGDGKYDIPVIEYVGLGLTPNDAISEVQEAAEIVLTKNGGQGCIAEIYTLLKLKY